MKTTNKPITVAITGASGFIYGLRLLQFLLNEDFKVDLILSKTAFKVAQLESNLNLQAEDILESKKQILNHLNLINNKSLNLWSESNLAASISSGSYQSEGMIIIPCSMGCLGRIANGISDDLIARCADVCLKERNKLILVARETPLNTIHLQNMLTLSQLGAIILPAMPAFYHQPKDINDLINFVVGKTLDSFGIDHRLFKRWAQA
jgi:flavin prenyltransferase